MTSRQRRQLRSGGRRVGKVALSAVSFVFALASFLTPGAPSSAVPRPDPKLPAEREFRPVLERMLRGDLVMAGNSNLLSAGGWRPADITVADVDRDTTELCIIRGIGRPRACADNSSSARLDVPDGARIVAARLYVQTTVAEDVGPLRVRIAGPRRRDTYLELGGATPGVRKVYEAAGAGRGGAPLRQAVWDVTKYVARRGAGSYTVADIVSERAAPYLPYASWAIVAAYELDPEHAQAFRTLSREERARFRPRAVSWYDGFTYLGEGSLSVPVSGFAVPLTGRAFAKTFHVVGHGQRGAADNLLFNGGPLGNNLTPGDAPPPPGVVIGANRSCNSTTDVMNDTVCVLGTPAARKRPGRRAYYASGDGRTRSSGSGVDMDVLRVPDRYLVPGSTSATLTVQVTGSDTLAPGMLAVSVDQPRARLPLPRVTRSVPDRPDGRSGGGTRPATRSAATRPAAPRPSTSTPESSTTAVPFRGFPTLASVVVGE